MDMRNVDYAFDGVTSDFWDYETPNLLDRAKPMEQWFKARATAGVNPYSKSTSSRIAPTIAAKSVDRRPYGGVNFASQEYLSLASHPAIISAAKAAIDEMGVHSAGSAALMGLTEKTIELEKRVATFLEKADATVFPTGWGAGYGVIKTLVRPTDHVVIDVLAHACLQEGAKNATSNVHSFPHLSNEGVARRLERIRKTDNNGILVVTETVFSMDSDVPNIKELKALCLKYNATLLVDVAHDLGAIGPTGRGYLELQDALDAADIVMGSFSKSFASNGGFVATNATSLKDALRYGCGPLTFTNSLSPLQAAVVLECFNIIESLEGAERRERLMENIHYMRTRLLEADFEILGQPSAIIPVMLGGSRISRLMTKYALEHGAIVNLVEYPAVAKNGCRWRVQVMADHTKAQIHRFIEIAKEARASVTVSSQIQTS